MKRSTDPKRTALLDSPPLVIQKELAIALNSLTQALVLQQLHYLLLSARKNQNEYTTRNGHQWVYNSYKQWKEDHFPFWSEAKIARALRELEERNLIVSDRLDAGKYDQRKWYRIDYDALDKLCTLDDDKMEASGVADSQNGTEQVAPIMSETTPETTPETTLLAPDGANGHRPVTGRNLIKKELEIHFSEVSGFKRPDPQDDEEKKACSKSHWQPLLRIAREVDDDVGAAKEAITSAVEYMRKKELPFCDPRGIEKVAKSEAAKRKVNNNGRDSVPILHFIEPALDRQERELLGREGDKRKDSRVSGASV